MHLFDVEDIKTLFQSEVTASQQLMRKLVTYIEYCIQISLSKFSIKGQLVTFPLSAETQMLDTSKLL